MFMDSFRRGWFRSLGPDERPALVAHWKRLSPDSLRRRFLRPMRDEDLETHAARALAPGAETIGWFHDGVLRAVTDIYLDRGVAEAAFSVEAAYRGRGIGRRLLDHALRRARNRHCRTLLVMTTRDNMPMVRLALSAGARLEHDGTDVVGHFDLGKADPASHFADAAEEEAGWLSECRRGSAGWPRPGCPDASGRGRDDPSARRRGRRRRHPPRHRLRIGGGGGPLSRPARRRAAVPALCGQDAAMSGPAPLADQGVLIFGGSSGIGRAVSAAFRAEGADVALVGRHAGRGAAVAAELDARFLSADCGVPEQIETAVADAEAHLGRIDTAVISLGGNRLPELLHRQSLATVAATVAEDLTPTLLAARAVLPGMRAAGGGTVLAIASDAAKVATPGEAVIGANMAAIVQFIRGIAVEGRRDGIRANAITPSLVEGTPLTERLMAEGSFSAKLFAKARPLAGLGPTGPEDLAALAVFLAGPAAAKITGQAISVNGGISAA